MNGRQPLGAWHGFRADGHRTGHPHAITLFEILVGIVEDDEGLLQHRLQLRCNLRVESIDLGIQGCQIGFVSRLVCRIGITKALGDFSCHRLCIARVEPEMHVGAAMLVFIVVMTLMGIILVPVAITGGNGFFRRVVVPVIIGMLGLGMIVMAGFFGAMIMRMVISAFAGLGMVTMVVTLKGTAFAERQLGQARRVFEFDHLGILRQSLERLVQEGFETRAHPENDVGIFECPGVGRLQRVGMRGGGTLDDQRRLADTLHDRSDERVDRLDRDHDIRRCHRESGRQEKQRR